MENLTFKRLQKYESAVRDTLAERGRNISTNDEKSSWSWTICVLITQ